MVNYLDEKGKLQIKKIGAALLKKCKIITISDTGDMYLYTDGVYAFKQKVTENKIKNIIRVLLDTAWTKQRSAEVVEYVKLSTLTDRELLDTNEFIINVKNGLYNVLKNKLLKHDPSYFSTFQLNVTYDPAAECPIIDKYLYSVTTPEDVPLLVQYAGYCCITYIKQERALIITGGMHNGKSTFINLVVEMIGIGTSSMQSLQSLSTDRFAKGELEGKLINTYPDLPSEKLYDNSTFKTITSDPWIDGDRKFGQKRIFKNTIHQIYSANDLPELDNPDELAFFRRLIQVDFPNSFEDKKNSNLIEEMSTDSEIAGFFNIAMVGLRMLLHYDAFCEDKTAIEKKDEYLAKSDPLSQFIYQCTDDTDGTWDKSDFEATFIEWCKTNKAIPVSSQSIGRKMKKQGYKYGRSSVGNREYYWINISPKENTLLNGTQTESWTKEFMSSGTDMLTITTNPSKCLSNNLLLSKYIYIYYMYYVVRPFYSDTWTDSINKIGEPFKK